MHLAEFLTTDDDTLRTTIADMRRRADAMDKVVGAKRGVYSPQATLRNEAAAMERLLDCRIEERRIRGAAVVTFSFSGSNPGKKMPKSHKIFEIEEL